MKHQELLDLSFDEFMLTVDKILVDTITMKSSCLADFDYHAYYMTGATPIETAQMALDCEFGTRAPKARHLRLV